ncbi:MAG TPA: cyclic nucleotide-binding domain-containing protein [bacterium]|nr:cyclic nucleotide-binding domain-containing protein [bacterium]
MDANQLRQIIDVFKKSSIFAGLGDDDLKKIAEGCSEQSYPIGTVIIEENDPPKEVLYLLRQGDIVVTTAQFQTEDDSVGSETMITTLGPGDAFGEIALIDEMPHSATVKTMSDSVVIQLPASHFFALTELDKNIGFVVVRNISRVICQRLRSSNFVTKHFVQYGSPDGQDIPDDI